MLQINRVRCKRKAMLCTFWQFGDSAGRQSSNFATIGATYRFGANICGDRIVETKWRHPQNHLLQYLGRQNDITNSCYAPATSYLLRFPFFFFFLAPKIIFSSHRFVDITRMSLCEDKCVKCWRLKHNKRSKAVSSWPRAPSSTIVLNVWLANSFLTAIISKKYHLYWGDAEGVFDTRNDLRNKLQETFYFIHCWSKSCANSSPPVLNLSCALNFWFWECGGFSLDILAFPSQSRHARVHNFWCIKFRGIVRRNE